MDQLCESLRATPEQELEDGGAVAVSVDLGIPQLDAVQRALDQSVAYGKTAQGMAVMEFIQLTTGAATIERNASALSMSLSKLVDGQIVGKPEAWTSSRAIAGLKRIKKVIKGLARPRIREAQVKEWQAACRDLVLDMVRGS